MWAGEVSRHCLFRRPERQVEFILWTTFLMNLSIWNSYIVTYGVITIHKNHIRDIYRSSLCINVDFSPMHPVKLSISVFWRQRFYTFSRLFIPKVTREFSQLYSMRENARRRRIRNAIIYLLHRAKLEKTTRFGWSSNFYSRFFAPLNSTGVTEKKDKIKIFVTR